MARKLKNKCEQNNYQDEAMVKEYDKGRRAGRKNSKSSNRGRSDRNNRRAGTNDPEFYNAGAQITKDVASFTFEASLGLPIVDNMNPRTAANTIAGLPEFQATSAVKKPRVFSAKNIPTPGIMALHIVPTIGNSSGVNDPINKAMNQLYAYIQQNKSGKLAYEAPDVAFFILSLGNAFAFYKYCTRLYATAAHKFSAINRYEPRALVTANKVDWQSLRSNLADFRTWINLYARELRSFAVPKDINYFKRQEMLYETYYADAETAKAQYYCFVPSGFYVFSEGTPSSVIPKLTYTPLNNSQTPLTVQQLMEYGDSLISPISGSNAMRRVQADMLYIFKAEGCWSVPEIPENYDVEIRHDKAILSQMENAYIYGDESSFTGFITQQMQINASYLRNQVTMSSTLVGEDASLTNGEWDVWNYIQAQKNVLNFHWDNVSSADILEATRLAGFGITRDPFAADDDFNAWVPITMGTEIVSNARVWYYSYGNADGNEFADLSLTHFDFKTMDFQQMKYAAGAELVQQAAATVTNQLAVLSKFDWHPQVRICWFEKQSTTAVTNMEVGDLNFDLDNFAIYDAHQLKNINYAALLGEFTVRSMGAYSKQIIG